MHGVLTHTFSVDLALLQNHVKVSPPSVKAALVVFNGCSYCSPAIELLIFVVVVVGRRAIVLGHATYFVGVNGQHS